MSQYAWKCSDKLFKYIQMLRTKCDLLLENLKDNLSKKEANCWKPVSPGEKLLVTVR
jgi:hypothetical protein